MVYYIYILYSESADKYYVGYTDNFKRRLKQHNEPQNSNTFTSKHQPWKPVVLFQCGEDKAIALKIEHFIKKQKSRSLILKLINPDFIPVGELEQLVRVSYTQD